MQPDSPAGMVFSTPVLAQSRLNPSGGCRSCAGLAAETFLACACRCGNEGNVQSRSTNLVHGTRSSTYVCAVCGRFVLIVLACSAVAY